MRHDSLAGLSWTAARLAAHQAGISAMLADVTLPAAGLRRHHPGR
jgi:hypothetical protein